MKPKPSFDPEFAIDRRPRAVMVCVRALLAVAAVAGLCHWIWGGIARTGPVVVQGANPAIAAPGGLVEPVLAAMPLAPTKTPPADQFVVMASPSIDPKMVHPAPDGIDQAMVASAGKGQTQAPILVAPPSFPQGIPPAPATP